MNIDERPLPGHTPKYTAPTPKAAGSLLLWIFGIIFVVFVLGCFCDVLGLAKDSFFEPKREALHAKVHRNSEEYVESKLNALRDYASEYRQNADPESRESIRSLVADEYASFDENQLEGHPALLSFLHEMEGEK